MKNVFAYTSLGPSPPYLSVNEQDGALTITVRSPAEPGQTYGPTAQITLDRGQARELHHKLHHKLMHCDTCSYKDC